MSELSNFLRAKLAANPPPTWTIKPEILLCPNTPKPMHGVVPREILGAKWWNATRKKAYESTCFRCQACGVHKTLARYHKWLEGHEWYDIDYEKGRLTYVETVPLCHFCHNYIHDGRLKHLLDKGEVHHAKYVAIIQHGDAVLEAAGLSKLSHIDREEEMRKSILNKKVAAWGDWRLILEGKEYPPKYKNYAEWERAHA